MCEVIRPRGYGDPLSPEHAKEIDEWLELRRKQLNAEPLRGLRRTVSESGWHCPNCGGAHAPDVHSCPEPPEPPKGGSLRERLKSAS